MTSKIDRYPEGPPMGPTTPKLAVDFGDGCSMSEDGVDDMMNNIVSDVKKSITQLDKALEQKRREIGRLEMIRERTISQLQDMAPDPAVSTTSFEEVGRKAAAISKVLQGDE